MTIKTIIFGMLILLITLDIILTILFVTFFGATEINPLCYNFELFMLIKIIASIIGLYLLYQLRNIQFWIIPIITLILIYGRLLIFNVGGIINYFLF